MRNQPEDHGIRAVIEGQAFSLYVDYDRPRLSRLSIDGKLQYLQRRFDFVVMEPLAALLDAHDNPPRNNGKESSTLIVWANTMLCAIEALGHFLTPPSVNNSQAFRTFVAAFMDPSWEDSPVNPPPGIDTYTRWLWDSFRNGLTHGAYIKNGGFERLGDRLFIESPNGLQVDVWAFDVDFRRGVAKMHQSLHQPQNHFRSTFVDRFDRTYVLGEA